MTDPETIEARLRAFEGSDALGNGDFSICTEAADLIASLRAEREVLRQQLAPQWFYLEGYEEKCLHSPDEAIDLADLEPGYHVLAVDTATPRPTIWCAVHVTDDEDADERFTFTEHASKEEALAALAAGEAPRG